MIDKKYKSNLGKTYTDDVINERVQAQGFVVKDIDRTQVIPYVYAECLKGHKRNSKATEIKSMECLYCEGRRQTLKSAEEFFGKEDYIFNSKPPLSIDSFGNKFLKAGERVDVTCKEGHVTPISTTEFSRGRRCTKCKETYRNHGYSRSEEIISRVLTYNNIYHERQKKMGDEFNNKSLDFYLPQLRAIIEYDGIHHVYGRSTDSEEDVKRIHKDDALRDNYAKLIGYNMVRIPYTFAGRALVNNLKDILKHYDIHIDVTDPYYDTIVREVFNYSSAEFGWLSYEDIKRNADTYRYNSLSESESILDLSGTVIAKHFSWVYGVNKSDFNKQIHRG